MCMCVYACGFVVCLSVCLCVCVCCLCMGMGIYIQCFSFYSARKEIMNRLRVRLDSSTKFTRLMPLEEGKHKDFLWGITGAKGIYGV